MITLLHAVMAATLASTAVADPPPKPLAERFDLLGLQVCLGALDDGRPCDVRLWAPQASRTSTTLPAGARTPTSPSTTTMAPTAPSRPEAPAPKPTLAPLEISLLGHTVCLGHESGDAACDVTLFPSRSREVKR